MANDKQQFLSFERIVMLLCTRLISTKIHANLAKVSFNLSDIGEGIREVIVKEWFVKIGDKVAQFDKICEVQSDKALATITSRYDGVITRLHYKIEETASVGRPLVDIETDDAIGETVEPQSVVAPLSTPSVKRMAKEYGIPLDQIGGTGKHGRILKEDLLKYLQMDSQQETDVHLHRTTSENIQLDGYRKIMFKTMTDSLKIPHFVFNEQINLQTLSELRNKLKNENGVKLGFLPFFIKSLSNCLGRYPIVNSVIVDDSGVTHKTGHNIGVAMDTQSGLVVPVLKNVQKMGIIAISDELKRLKECGAKARFTPDDLGGATFSVSNIGSIGGTYASPIINPPQVAIIAIGAGKLTPVIDDSNRIVGQLVANVSAAADHRIIDGATMAKFTMTFKKQIENPYLIFLDL